MESDDWLTCLYETQRQLLLLVAWNILHQRELAEDAVHTGIVKLAHLPSPPRDPRAFAIRTVRNIAIDILRKRGLRREKAWEDLPKIASLDSTATDLKEERLLLIENAIKQLDSNSQELIRLHLQGCLSFREIGELLALPTQTVASQYRRAIIKLRSFTEVQYE